MSNFIKLSSKVTIFDYQTYCISVCKGTRTAGQYFSQIKLNQQSDHHVFESKYLVWVILQEYFN